MILNEQERSFKDRVWKNLNKQWITDQNDKKRLKKLELKQRRALKATSSFASSSQIESLDDINVLQPSSVTPLR